MCSAPVRNGSSAASWRAAPIEARTSSPSVTTSKPATRAVPEVGGSSVVSMCTVVDLPAPLGPRKPYTSPGSTRRSIPSTARGPFLNSRTSCVASMAGSLMANQVTSEARQRCDAVGGLASPLPSYLTIRK